MFSCKYCEVFKNTSGGCFCIVQVIVLCNDAQADQDNIA